MGKVIGKAGVFMGIHYLSAVYQARRRVYIDCRGSRSWEGAAFSIISEILHRVPEKHCHNKPTSFFSTLSFRGENIEFNYVKLLSS